MTERIRQLGGTLNITSEPGRGTLVSAHIPFVTSQLASSDSDNTSESTTVSAYVKEAGLLQSSADQRKRILIADDHAMLRRGVRNTLQSQPEFEICGEAVDGQDAVEKVKQLQPDLVILDINMPSLNGLVAIRQILRHQPQTKVVIFSVHNSDQTMQEARSAGAHGFISKGKDGAELLRVVREVLNGKPARPPMPAPIAAVAVH
jgi:CheY-like chemotaxis protein